MYADTQKREIENIISVFKEYIQTSEYIDLLWSDKVGYILFYINPPTRDMALEPAVIKDASELCELLISEIATDVLELTRNEHSFTQADPLEKSKIIKRMEPFAEQLPEYRHLIDELFIKADE